ncbi:hypothetical protein ACFV1L_24380 [Kitasatospora sp. NPDC059646]
MTTRDEAERAAHLRRFRTGRPEVDGADLRVDVFCGRPSARPPTG